MSRRRTAAGARARASRPRLGPARVAVLLAALLAGAGAGAWMLTRGPASRPPPATAPLPPREAIGRALALNQRSRFTESLPLYRAALAAASIVPEAHRLYASALYASTFETREDGTSFARSSLERVAAMRIADRELALFERLPLKPDERWEVLDTRGLWNAYWGFPWEALEAFRRAAAAAPGHATAAATAAAMEDRLRRPHLSTLPLSGSVP